MAARINTIIRGQVNSSGLYATTYNSRTGRYEYSKEQFTLGYLDMKFVRTLAESSAMIKPLNRRKSMFDTVDQMMLTAVGSSLELRLQVEAERDKRWNRLTKWADENPLGYETVIIGSGPNAATFAANWVQLGYNRPLVIEANKRIGGKFADTTMAAWYLNSRSRRGDLGIPSEAANLNVIPGGPIQPSNFTMAEYPTNVDMAFAVRSAHARYSDVRPNSKVMRIDQAGDSSVRKYAVVLSNGVVYADRVIDARGLGADTLPQYMLDSDKLEGRIETFTQFMQRQDKPFPMEGLKRVAVVGGGDSGKCVVEALIGQGPGEQMQASELDYVDQVDWYDEGLPDDCDTWRQVERGRYQKIGGALRTLDNGVQRLRVFNERAFADLVLEGARIGSRTYDLVVYCIGFAPRDEVGDPATTIPGQFNEYADRFTYGRDDTTKLARGFGGATEGLYQVGPIARLSFDDNEPEAVRRIENNLVAMFRLLPKTATLAGALKGMPKGEFPDLPESLRPTTKTRLLFKNDSGGFFVGDQVRFQSGRIDTGRGQFITGTLTGFSLTSGYVKRDDGKRGTGPNGEFKVDQVSVEKVSVGAIIGMGRRSKIRIGDRVEFTDDAGNRVTGTMTSDTRISAERDDDVRGGGIGESYLIRDINTVDLIG